MSKTNFTPDEAAQIAAAFTMKRVGEIAKNLKELRERELKKAIVPPHKHTTGSTASSGVEDIPPGKLNPPGKNDVLKSKLEETTSPGEETSTAKEGHCKDCGKASHDDMEKCMGKAMLKDSKGKEIDNGIVDSSVLPEDKKSKEVSADGSGGDIKKAAMPPMAKPPSGKNMNTAVPTSKPGGMVKQAIPPVAVIKKPGIFGRLNKSETLAKKASVTQPVPTLKPAASGMHTVGGGTHSTPIPQDKTGVVAPPKALGSTGPTLVNTIPSFSKPKPVAPARSPVTIPLPKLKAPGKLLAPAMGDGPQDGTRTIAHVSQNEPTKAAKPHIMTPPGKVKP